MTEPNVKGFRLIITESTPYDTNMFLFEAEGGDMLKFETQLSLQSFGGTSASESDPIRISIVSDSDTSGSPVGDPGGDFALSGLAQFIIPDGWPRPVPGIDGLPPLDLQIQAGQAIDRIPSRGRNLYLRIEEPATLPDSNAEYSLELFVTVTKL